MKENKISQNKRNLYLEILINFALIYSFILGMTLAAYSYSRGFFKPYYYILALILFVTYLVFWIIDKKRFLNECTTT